MSKKRIPNPSRKMTSVKGDKAKQQFIQEADTDVAQKDTRSTKSIAKGYPISMYPEFIQRLDEFLKDFPEERSRSALLVRSAEVYMKLKREDRII